MSDGMDVDKSDIFLKELKDIASGKAENDPTQSTEEPPIKKAKISEFKEVITKKPVMLTEAQANEFMESMHQSDYISTTNMSEKHSMAPLIPIVSEVPLPSGYNPNRSISEGITAGRNLVNIPTHLLNKKFTGSSTSQTPHERNISKIARDSAPFEAPQQYYRKKAGEEWCDPTLSEWNPSKYFNII